MSIRRANSFASSSRRREPSLEPTSTGICSRSRESPSGVQERGVSTSFTCCSRLVRRREREGGGFEVSLTFPSRFLLDLRVEAHPFLLAFVVAEDLLLDGSAADYEYLNKSAQVIDGVNDLEEWKLLTVSSLRRVALSLSSFEAHHSLLPFFFPSLGRCRRRRLLQRSRTTRPLPYRRRHPPSRKHRNLRRSIQPSSNPNPFPSRESLSPPRNPTSRVH